MTSGGTPPPRRARRAFEVGERPFRRPTADGYVVDAGEAVRDPATHGNAAELGDRLVGVIEPD